MFVKERARLANEEPQILGIKICVSIKLLKPLAKYELRSPQDRIIDEMVLQELAGGATDYR